MGKQVCPECGKAVPIRNGTCPSCLLSLGLREVTNATEPERVRAGDVIGRYRLVKPVGEGAFGTVWLAKQEAPVQRTVALKILKLGMNSREVNRRFEAERQALALMDHPNIARVFDGGTTEDGRPFFAMEFVPGTPLTEFCDEKQLSTGERLRLFMRVCEGVQHAHYKGVIHRDLKPGNILVAGADGRITLKVIDFGVAKAVEEPLTRETMVTRFNQFLGTPAYMSPEQFGIGEGDIDTRSDIYSLGVVLYELLTGRTPFAENLSKTPALDGLLQTIREAEPPPPSTAVCGLQETERSAVALKRGVSADRLARTLRGDLDWIVLKALEKERKRRYQSAGEMAKDIQNHLEHGVVEATAPGVLYRATKFARRNRAAVISGCLVILILISGLAVSLSQRHRALMIAEKLRREVYIAGVRLAYDAWKEGNLKQAQALLASSEEDLRDFQWRKLRFLCQDEAIATFTNAFPRISPWTAGVPHPLSFSTDGKSLISANSNSLLVLKLREGSSEKALPLAGGPLRRFAVASRRPGLIAILTDAIRVMNERGELLLGGQPLASPSYTMALSGDGKLMAAVGDDRVMRLVDVESGGAAGEELDLTGRSISNLAFSPEGRYLVAGTETATILILTTAPLAVEREIRGHTAFVQSFAFDSAGRRLASGANDGHIRVWSFPEGEELMDITAHFGRVSQVAFSPDDQLLASGGWDSMVRVWDLTRPSQAIYLRGHGGPVGAILFSLDGRELYTGSDDQTVKAWRVPSAESTNTLRHTRWVNDVAFSPDGQLLAAEDYHARATVLWDVIHRRPITNLFTHSPEYYGGRVRFSGDGRFLAAAGQDALVKVWNIEKGKQVFALPITRHPTGNPPAFIGFHPLQPILAIARYDLEFWNLLSGEKVNLLENQTQRGVDAIAFASDGRWFALGTLDSQISIWNLKNGRRITRYEPPESQKGVGAIAFSNDGNLLASSSSNFRIAIYDVRDKRVFRTLEGHTGKIVGLAFTPDNKTLVSASYDGTIRFWYVANGQQGLTLNHGGGGLSSVVFSPDGNLMATAGADGMVRLWPAAPF